MIAKRTYNRILSIKRVSKGELSCLRAILVIRSVVLILRGDTKRSPNEFQQVEQVKQITKRLRKLGFGPANIDNAIVG